MSVTDESAFRESVLDHYEQLKSAQETFNQTRIKETDHTTDSGRKIIMKCIRVQVEIDQVKYLKNVIKRCFNEDGNLIKHDFFIKVLNDHVSTIAAKIRWAKQDIQKQEALHRLFEQENVLYKHLDLLSDGINAKIDKRKS